MLPLHAIFTSAAVNVERKVGDGVCDHQRNAVSPETAVQLRGHVLQRWKLLWVALHVKGHLKLSLSLRRTGQSKGNNFGPVHVWNSAGCRILRDHGFELFGQGFVTRLILWVRQERIIFLSQLVVQVDPADPVWGQ